MSILQTKRPESVNASESLRHGRDREMLGPCDYQVLSIMLLHLAGDFLAMPSADRDPETLVRARATGQVQVRYRLTNVRHVGL